ncbi:MAG: hypothetical protein COC23_07270 [Hyphomicrobiales bacterium]|nr:MAG: hypothetical protein COC23_07270 [Hyphomicrobiales bacterium]
MEIPSPLTQRAHWLLRIAVASVFLYHGILKFSDLQGFTNMLPISYTQVVLAAFAQVAGSLLLLAGGLGRTPLHDIATRLGALANVPVMIGAITLVHWGRWNFVPTETHPLGGMEFQVTLILLMIFIAITGNPKTIDNQ